MSRDSHPERLQLLLEKFAANRCSQEELLELMRAVEQGTHDEALHHALMDAWERLSGTDEEPSLNKEAIFRQVVGTAPVRRERPVWGRAAAAAAIILLLGGGVFWYVRRDQRLPAANVAATRSPGVKRDVAPGGNKAILTLSDGTDIVLDSVREGRLSQQGNAEVTKTGKGQLAYRTAASHEVRAASELVYNKITTPRGGQYKVTLPDGSKVWLNAASSLRFPTAFTGDDRTVELSGEAYFEIEKDKRKPFYVQTGHTKVAVLGTSFNVMAYEEEGVIRTTLLDGAVQVTGTSGAVMRLSPGQQVQCWNDGALKLVKDPNMEEAMAWKNDLFYFHGTNIQTIMRQLARWYDIDVTYSVAVNGRFYAKIPRNTNLSIVLRALALTNKLNFTQEGRTVTVIP
ncbi:MAG: FecR family protein [Chitinophagaceae bacterium]|nr:FecR family protein [Chitinophagaceae bacterium]